MEIKRHCACGGSKPDAIIRRWRAEGKCGPIAELAKLASLFTDLRYNTAN
jgi:hypothetical protein